MSAQKAIYTALGKRLQALALPTAYEGAEFVPASGTLYLRESFLPGTTSPVGMAFGSTNNYVGIYQIDVCSPLGKEHKAAALAAIEQVLTQFARGTTLTESGVDVTLHRADRLPAMPDGDRWVTPISVRYRAFAKG